MMAGWRHLADYKPGAAMVVVQVIFAFMSLSAKALFSNGTSPMVFVVFRQAVATLVMLPTALLARGPRKMAVGVRGFGLLFTTSLVGCTLNQYAYYQGLKMTSSSITTAMNNLIPAITFLMAASLGLEKLQLRSIRSLAKVLGTLVCVGGAVSMALYKGPRLLNVQYNTLASVLLSVSMQWIIGCLYLLASTCFGSLWLILQVPICKKYLDPLCLSAWICILSTFQSAALTAYLEPNLQTWKINSMFELLCCLYAGIFASGITFCLQSWAISERGPLFTAMFFPVQTIVTTILAFVLLNEELRIGSLIGAVFVVVGLYIVLWGKAKDLDSTNTTNQGEYTKKISVSVDTQGIDCEDGMKEPLLNER